MVYFPLNNWFGFLGLNQAFNFQRVASYQLDESRLMAPSVGVEPTALPLTGDCSTDELTGNNVADRTSAALATSPVTGECSTVELPIHMG